MEVRVDYPKLIEVRPHPNDKNQSVQYNAGLKEAGGERIIIIGLNNVSFHLLAWELGEVEGRPHIFKFIPECLLTLQSNIEKVVITDIISNLYRAKVTIKDGNHDRTYDMELFVTDAMALAIAAKCPLFVDEVVFEKNEIEKQKILENPEIDKVQKMFNEMDPSKLKKH